MTKANIEFPNGTRITIEGSPEEIARATTLIQEDSPYSKGKTRIAKKNKPKAGLESKKKSEGPMDRIKILMQEDFFKTTKNLKDITDGLATKGHTYPTTSISPVMVRLVRNGTLRRLKEKKQWVYVNP